MVADSTDLCEIENYQENTNTNSNDNAFPVSTNGKFNNYGCCTPETAKEYDCWNIFQPDIDIVSPAQPMVTDSRNLWSKDKECPEDGSNDYAFPVNKTFNNYGCCTPKIAKEYDCRNRFQKEDGNSSTVIQDEDWSKGSVYVVGRNGIRIMMIVLKRPNHKKTPRVNTCFFICKVMFLNDHWETTVLVHLQKDWLYPTLALKSSLKRIFFHDMPHTSDDKHGSSDTHVLQKCNILVPRKYIHTKEKTNVTDKRLTFEIVLSLLKGIIRRTKRKHIIKRMEKMSCTALDDIWMPLGFENVLDDYQSLTTRFLGLEYTRFELDEKRLEIYAFHLKMNEVNAKLPIRMWDHLKIEQQTSPCDENDVNEKDNSDCIPCECTSDKDDNQPCLSKSWLEEDMDEELPISIDISFEPEQIKMYTQTNKRLETYITLQSPQIDFDSYATAGFFYTGECLTCFCCIVCIDVSHLCNDPWMEHTKNSPGCDYVRSMKGKDYIHFVLAQSNKEKEGKHSENHPVDATNKADLLTEKKFLDPPDLDTPDLDTATGIIQESTCVHTVQKHSSLGRLQLFDNTKGNKKPTIHIKASKNQMFNIKDLLKNLCAASNASKEVPANSSARQSKDTLEFIGNVRGLLGEVQDEIHIHVYMVPTRMSRISSYSIWPHRNIRTGPLVEAGFSCKDPNTPTVECKSCGLELNASNLNGMNPMQYHRENSPDCEFFHQTNSERPRGQQNRPLTDSSPNPGVPPVGVNQEAAAQSLVQQPPGNNQQKHPNQGQAQMDKQSEANVSSAQTHSGNNAGNVCIDEATSPNSYRQAANASSLFSNSRGASLGSLTAEERPRTGEASDRSVSNLQNNNSLSSRGEEVRENENTIGALGGEIPHQIRNPRYTEQNARRESYAHWPHRARHDIEGLVNAGFFYTGAEDIVRCFFCDIGLAEWNPDDDPWVEHARHSPECPYLRDQKGQDYINNIQTQWARIYTPKHPQYTQMDARRRSYVNTGWPRDNVLQAPELLAAAGFFYTGDGDTVRCHYCDGGLREWEPEDDPWVEHARWFPFCKFVLKIKGIDFIQASATGNPANGLQAPVAPPAAQRTNEAPLTLSHVDKCRIKEQKNPMHSAAAQSIRTMGYSSGTVYLAIDKFLAKYGRRDFKAVDLMDIIMELEDLGMTFSDGEDENGEIGASDVRGAAGGNNGVDADEEMNFSPAALRKENEYLKQTFKCKTWQIYYKMMTAPFRFNLSQIPACH